MSFTGNSAGTNPGGNFYNRPNNTQATRQAVPQHYPALAINIGLQVERRLPVRGEVMATPGMRVEADTPIARTLIPGRPRLFNLSDFLDVEPKEVSKLLLKEVNDRLTENELLAQKRGFGGKTFRAPFECVISAFDKDTGYISLTPLPKPFTLEAFVRGQVAEIIPEYGVKLEVRASYARGVFGFGDEQHGVLRTLVTEPNQPLQPDLIDQRSTFFIVLGGSTVSAETLERAVAFKVRGIIAGSIREEELNKFLGYRNRSSLYKVGQNLWRFPADVSRRNAPLTLVITEGFGTRAMAGRLYEMLVNHNGQEISISGTTQLRRSPQRPEIIVPVTPAEANLPSTSLNPSDQVPRINSIVRLINPSFAGVTARIVGLPIRRSNTNSGQLSRVAEVEANGHRLMVPFSDLEVLEQLG